MQFTGKVTVGTRPEMDWVGRNNSLIVEFNAAENHNKNVGTKDNPKWETASTSWYKITAWEDLAQRIIDDNIKEGDFIEIEGTHKINKVQKENEKAQYFNVYTLNDYKIISQK